MDLPARSFRQRLVTYFLAGIFAVLPLVITVLTVTWAVGFLNGLVGPNTFLGEGLSRLGLNFVSNSETAYVLGWIGVLTGIFLLGFLVESGMRKLVAQLTDSVLMRVPLVGKVYDAAKQIVDMLGKQGGKDLEGMSVVYCAFGGQDGVGLLALLPTPKVIPIKDRNYHVVLVPQSPVPIGGALMFVPVESVVSVEMSVEKFMSAYVSMGVTVPATMGDPAGEIPPAGSDAEST